MLISHIDFSWEGDSFLDDDSEEDEFLEEVETWSFYAKVENYDTNNPGEVLEIQGECDGTEEKLLWLTIEKGIELKEGIQQLLIEKIEIAFKNHLSDPDR